MDQSVYSQKTIGLRFKKLKFVKIQTQISLVPLGLQSMEIGSNDPRMDPHLFFYLFMKKFNPLNLKSFFF